MKRINTILNIVLSIAVIILFILFFSKNKMQCSAKNKPITDTSKATKTIRQLPVAYVNNDSILKKYKLVKDMKDEFNSKMNAYQNELQQKMQKLQSDVQKFQQDARYMTQSEGQAKQKELMQRQQSLAQMRDNLTQKLANEEDTMNKILKAKVTDLLKQHSQTENYQIIFGYSDAGNILYANSMMNITPMIIKELNDAYDAKNASTKKDKSK